MRRSHTYIGAVLLCVMATLGVHSQSSLRLSLLKQTDGLDSVCLANVRAKNCDSDNAILSHEHTLKPRIGINGRDVTLKQVRDYLPDNNFRVGKGGHKIFKGSGVTARLDYVFTWLCPKKQENCEVYYYRGTLDVTYRGNHRRVKIVGYGGT